MKAINLLIISLCLFPWIVRAQLAEVEGDVKLNNTLEICDDSSGDPVQVGSLSAIYPAGASSENSPTLTLATATSPVFANTFADIILESSDKIFFNTNTETRMYVGQAGRVGIGTTSPLTLLQVLDDVVIGGGSTDYQGSGEYIRFRGRNQDWFSGAQNQENLSNSGFYIGKSAVPDGMFHIENSGDVGIGTTDPTAKLTVEDSGGNPFRTTTTNDDNFSTYYTDNGYIGYHGVYSGNADMDFGTGVFNNIGSVHLVIRTEPKLTIDPDGNTGIGTTSPQAELHVSGGTGSAQLLLEADTNNSGEANQPRIVFSQDGGGVTGGIGYFNSTNNLSIRNDFGGASIRLLDNGDIIIGN